MTTPDFVVTSLVSLVQRVRKEMQHRRLRLAVLIGILGILGPFSHVSRAQDYQTALGVPPFMTALPVESGSIDASTGNLHIEVPLGSYPQRGLPPVRVSLVYDSTIWSPAGGVWQANGYWTGVLNPGAGWHLVMTGAATDNPQYESDWHTCPNGASYTTASNFSWVDAFGTSHLFPITTTDTHYGSLTQCMTDTPNGDAFATDSSGYHMFITGYAYAVVYAPDGSIAYNTSSGVPVPQYDTNGNYLTTTGWPPQDTLGRTPFSTGTPATCPSGYTCFAYNVPNSTGSTSQYVVQILASAAHTNFGQSGITECSSSCTLSLITKITLPDNTSYSFTYDDGTVAGDYAMLKSMTLPAGATINYTYTNFPDAYGNTSRWIASRANGSGTWNYSQSVVSTCTSTSVGCEQTFTVTQPSLDNEVYTFELDNGAWPIQMQSYNGSISSSNILATQTTGWDFTHGCVVPASICIGHQYVTKLSDTAALPIPGSTSLSRTSQYTYDTSTNDGNITTVKEWNFYSGSLPSTPSRITNMTYLTGTAYAAVNIMNRPASVIVTDGTGSTQYSKTLYTYDATSPGLTSATGFVNHDDTDYGTGYLTRGNLTQVQKWISGSSSYLTSSLVYDTTGQVVSATDPAGNTTTLSYTDSFYNDGTTPSSYTPSTPTHAYLTQVTQPTVGSASLVSNFSYYYGTGQIATSTDVNGMVTTAHYLDPFSRPTLSTAAKGSSPTGWSLTTYTPATSTPTPMYVDSYTAVNDASASTSCSFCIHSQIDFDSLGRPQYNKVMNNPDGVTTSQTSYDTNGRPYNATAPNFSSGSITAADTTAYDGLNRPTVISHADTTASYAYYGPAVTSSGAGGNGTQQCGPPTATCPYAYPVLSKDEAGKLHQTWTDGFGRLVEVDEPGGAATAGAADGTATGTEQSVSAGATGGHGTVTISGAEQSTVVEIDPTCITMDCSGNCLAWSNGSRFGTPTYNTVYDYGTVSITANGHTDSTTYGSSSTTSSIASALNTVINADSSASVTSTVSGSVLTLTAKTTGASTNYSLSATSSTSDPTDFGSGSFSASPSGSALTGGAAGGALTYDAGTVTVTVNGHADTVSYGSSDTSSTVASALASYIHADSSASVDAASSGTTITLWAKTTGSSTNYSFSSSSSTSDPTLFSSPSFSISVSGSALTGGANATTPSLATPLVTTYVYDVVGNLLQVNQGVQTRTFTYDGLGRTTSASIPETTPTGGSQQTSSSYYDSNTTCSNSFPGQLVSTVDARGVRTCFQYDALGRLTQKSYIVVSGVPSTSTVSYTYDYGGASANALGRLTSMTDGVGSETYTYDAGGRVTQLAKVISSNTYTTNYTYNVAGEPLSIAYPSSHTAYSAYDRIGRLCAVGGSTNSCSSNSTPYATMATSNAYNAANQLLKFTYGNNVQANLGYSNTRLQMTSLAYTNSSSTLLLGLNYYYTYTSPNCTTGTTGNNGQIQCIGDVTSTAAAGRSAAYTYDELGRLSSALTSGSTGSGSYSQWGLAFTYDRYGNLLKEQSSGSANTTCIAVSASTNQVTGTCALPSLSTYSYDKNGNMLGDGENILTYDAENRTTNATQGSTSVADYVYDGNGNRVKKCTPSCSASSPTITAYIFSGSKVIAEYTVSSGTPTLAREYLYAGGLKVATMVAGTPTYHLRDHLSVRVNTDTSGAILGEQGHYPFGDIWYPLNTTTKEMFTTYERDPETGSTTAGSGNDYAMARYNVNRLGRFSSIDPVSADVTNPQTLNRYAYVTNDPINLSDPLGQDATPLSPGVCILDVAVGYGVTACGDLCEVRVSSTCDETGGGGGGGHVNFSFDFPGDDDDNPFGESNGLPYGIAPQAFSLFNLLFGGNQQCEFGACGNGFFGLGGLNSPSWLTSIFTPLCTGLVAGIGAVAGGDIGMIGGGLAGGIGGTTAGPGGTVVGAGGGAIAGGIAGTIVGGVAGYKAGKAVCGAIGGASYSKGGGGGSGQVENREFAEAVRRIEKAIGRKLTPGETRRLHDEISGGGYTLDEIVQIGIGLLSH